MKFFLSLITFLAITSGFALSSELTGNKEKESLLSKLIAPGPLSNAHKQLEKKDCFACHTANKSIPNDKCLNCHNEIKKSQIKKGSFHSQFSNKKCIDCHKEHKGRMFDMAKLKIEKFDHSKTNFPLKGKHKQVKNCSNCHKKKRTFSNSPKFFGESTSCKDCHKKDDIHLFRGEMAKKDCNTCHSESGWNKNIKFNHFKVSGFQLTGKHKKLKCTDCHVLNNKKISATYHWKKSVKKCSACHKTPHKNEFSEKMKNISCSKCHTTENWNDMKKAKKSFNHSATKFKLTGAHKKLDCMKCHKDVNNKRSFLFAKKGKNVCLNCHKNPHKNQFDTIKSNKCTDCHTTKNFTKINKFNHSKTGFILKGKHKNVNCSDCHTKTKNKFPSGNSKSKFNFVGLKNNNCSTCHKDIHNGKMGKNCIGCHNENNWKSRDFHKNMKLVGAHKQLDCKQCHKDSQNFMGASNECITCHRKDDPHKGQLQDCSSCHTQKIWEKTTFKHSRTGFPLIGAHKALSCNECHRGGNFSGTSKDCSSCHMRDAIKVKAPKHTMPEFENCKKCHSQFTWSL